MYGSLGLSESVGGSWEWLSVMKGCPVIKRCPVDVVELVEEGSGWILAILAGAVELTKEDLGPCSCCHWFMAASELRSDG